ncbi:MAG: hypothetical protein LC744_05890 [Chloroflexi bacterium]|nr:hypothetical protein [Chloroflexota bacterium]
MALIAPLIAFIGRQLGRIVQVAFGWATMMLFGRVPQSKQLLLAVVALGSIAWVVTLVGIAFPDVGAFLIAFIPRPDFVEEDWIRLVMLVLAIVLPIGVGIGGLMLMDPDDRPKGIFGKVVQVLRGYPYAAVLALVILFLIVVAPIFKLRTISKRWSDAHIPIVVKPGRYDQVAADLEKALDAAGLDLAHGRAPRVLEAPSKLLAAVGGASVRRLVRLRGVGGPVPPAAAGRAGHAPRVALGPGHGRRSPRRGRRAQTDREDHRRGHRLRNSPLVERALHYSTADTHQRAGGFQMTMGTSTTYADPSIDTQEDGSSNGEQQQPLAEAGQQAGQSVGVLAERATGIGFQQADKAREKAAEGLTHVTDTIRRVSIDMQDQPAIANAAETVADQAERVGEYLRTTDARQMLSTIEDVARRQPLLFLGGAFMLGLAASRLIKAAGGSSSSEMGQQGHGQQWSSGVDYDATAPGGTRSGMGTDAITGERRMGEGI